MKRIFIVTASLALVSCNLAASLTGGKQSQTFAPAYEFLGQTHTMSISFSMENNVITDLAIVPGALSEIERAHQLAFAANVRLFVLGKTVDEIDIPATTGDEERLRKVFRGVVEELKTQQ